MRRRPFLIAVGAVTLLAGLVIMFPARVAYTWFAPPDLRLASISGTVWTGRAAYMETGGLYCRDIEWRSKPFALFRGQAAFAVKAALPSGYLRGDVAISIDNRIVLRDLTAATDLQLFEGPTGLRGLRGNLRIDAERVILEDGIPTDVAGNAEVSDLLVPLIHSAAIGGYRIEAFTQNSGIMASVEDTDGVVDIAGTFELLPDQNYRFVGLVAPKANTPPRLRQQLQYLGSPNDRGQREIRLEGIL